MISLFTELREMFRRIGLAPPRAKPLLIHILLLAAFGGLLPWAKGVEFMDPALPTIYACLGPFFAAPVAIQLVQTPGPYVIRALAATLYGEAFTLLALAAGIATVLLTNRLAYLYLPDPVYLAKALLMGFAATLALTAISAWITLKASPGWAMGLLRVVFVTLLIVFIFRSWWLPSYTGSGALLGFAVAALFLALLSRQPKRA